MISLPPSSGLRYGGSILNVGRTNRSTKESDLIPFLKQRGPKITNEALDLRVISSTDVTTTWTYEIQLVRNEEIFYVYLEYCEFSGLSDYWFNAAKVSIEHPEWAPELEDLHSMLEVFEAWKELERHRG